MIALHLKRIVPPQEEPITVAEVQEYLRTDEDEELLKTFIAAAREHAENFTRRALVTQTWEMTLDCFPPGNKPITIPLPPLQTVETVMYWDDEGNEQTLEPSSYIVFSQLEPGKVVPLEPWPEGRNVRIRFAAGYNGADNVPKPIKQAILLLVGNFYEVRADRLSTDSIVGVGSLQWGGQSVAETLLWPYRDVRL